MGSASTVLINQVFSMFVMLAVGYAAYRTHIVSDEGVRCLSNVVMYVAAPAVMVSSFLQPFSMEKLDSAGACALLTIIEVAITALIACASYRHRRGGAREAEGISRFAVIFSNTGFVGIPLVQSMLGDEYVFYVTVCISVVTFFVWTYGVYLVSGSLAEVSLGKVFTNPAVITLFVGFALFVLNVTLPDALAGACSTLGSINTGAAMLVLGCYLAQSRLSLILKDARVYKASFLRLIASPLATVLVLWLVPVSLMSSTIKMVILITFATPAGAMTAMLSQKYGANYEYGAGIVSVSTLFSLVTMPLMLQLGMLVL